MTSKEATIESVKIHEISLRHWTVSIGKVVKGILEEKYGIDPSSDFMRDYLMEIGGTIEAMSIIKRANILIATEFQERVRQIISENEGMRVSEAAKLARAEIKNFYEKLDEDKENNYSYLDSLGISMEV